MCAPPPPPQKKLCVPPNLWLLPTGLFTIAVTIKLVLSGHSKRIPKLGFLDRLSLNAVQKYCRMHSAILLNCIKLPLVIKIVLVYFWMNAKDRFYCLKRPLKKNQNLVFYTDYRLMQVKSIAECSKGSIRQYFWIALSYHLSLRSFLSIFEWPLNTLRDVSYNARWFWTTIRYRLMTTAYLCWTTGNGFKMTYLGFWTTVERGNTHRRRRKW